MNVLKRRALILTLLVLCLFGLTILGASAADTPTGVTAENKVPETTYVATAKFAEGGEDLYYTDLATAVAEAYEGSTVTLLTDVTLTAKIEITKALTIDGNDFAISTSTCQKVFEVYASANFVDVAITNTYAGGRCIDTRTHNIEVNMTNVTLTATGTNCQPLTIGGSDAEGLVVNMANTIIEAGKSGYAVITFVPVELTITDSDLSGFGVIYVKNGSAGSTIVVEGSSLTSNNEHSGETNSFATVVFETSGVSISLVESEVTATTTGDQPQCAFASKEDVVAEITIDATSTVTVSEANGSVMLGYAAGSAPKLNISAENTAVAEILNNEGFVAEDYDNDGVLDVAPPVEEGEVYVARVGTVLYTNLADALQAAAALKGSTLYVLADTTLDASDSIILSGAEFTIEGNGKTITAGTSVAKSGSIKLIEGGILSVNNITFAGYTGKNILYTGDTSATTYTYTVNFTGVTLNYASSGAFYGYQHASTAISLKDCVVNVLNFDGTRSLVNFTNAAASKNFTLTLDNTTLTDGANIVNPSFPFVASVGKSYFTDIATAVAAAQDGDTVYVLANATVADIALSGKSITLEGVGTVTVDGSASATAAFTLSDAAALTLKNISFTMGDKYLVQSLAGANTVTMENVNATTTSYVVHVNAGAALAEVTVTNGTFTAGTFAWVASGSLADLDITGATLKCAIYRTEATGGVLGSASDPATLTDVILDHNNGTASSGFTFRQKTTAYIAVFGGFYNLRPVNYNAAHEAAEAHNGSFITSRDTSEQYITLTINKDSSKTTEFHTAGRNGANANNIYNSVVCVNGSGKIGIEAYNTTFKAYAARAAFIATATSFKSDNLYFEGCTFDTPGRIFNTIAGTPVSISNCTVVSGTSGATTIAFVSDAEAVEFGMSVRVGDTEGGKVYYTNLHSALNAVSPSNTTVTNVYLLANTTMANVGNDGGAGTYFDAKYRSKVHITSKGTTPFTVTSSGTINFYLGSGAEIKFTNLIYNVGVRLARIDGSCSIIFGAGATFNCKDTIFIYDNGNTINNDHVKDTNPSYIENLTYSFEIQEGAVINSTGAIATALIYRSSNVSDANITLKIEGEIKMTAAKPIFSGDSKTYASVYVDVSKITCATTGTWFANTLRETGGAESTKLYAKGFESTAKGAAWGYTTGASAMTYSADPSAEWNYMFLLHSSMTQSQYSNLNSYGGEMWQLQSKTNIWATQYYSNLGTVYLKSYNGAKLTVPNATRFRVIGTTLILDGIEFVLNGGADIGIHGGSADTPSVLKLINGAKITASASTQVIKFMSDGNDLFTDKSHAHLIVTEGTSITGNAAVFSAPAGWNTGSVTIAEGTISTTGTGKLISIGNNTNIKVTIPEALFDKCENLLVSYNGSYFATIAGAIADVPTGATATITLLDKTICSTPITIQNQSITIVGLDTTVGDAEYDITYTGGGYVFNVYGCGNITFQNVNFYGGRPIMLYQPANVEGVAVADRDITLTLINSYIKAVGSSRFISSASHCDANTKGDTITINVDANSALDYEATSTDRRSMFEFYHNSHPYIVMNIAGKIAFKDHVDHTNAGWFFVSNNPSAATINFTETAQLNVDIANVTESDMLFYFTTGTNSMTFHENAILDDNGALTLGGMKLFTQYSSGAAPAVTIIADSDENQEAILGLIAEDKDNNSFSAISWLTEKDEKYYYGTLAAVIAAAENEGTVTLLQNTTVNASALLTGKTVTLTALENVVVTNTSTTYFVRMGSNTVLNVEDFKYQGNCFLSFTNSNGTAVLNLNDGAIIEGGDPTQANGYLIADAGDAKGAITLNINKGAQLVRPASYTLSGEVAALSTMLYFRTASTANITINVYGTLANLTTITADAYTAANGAAKPGLDANILSWNLPNATITVNIYDGGLLEGTCNDPQHSGKYNALFYFAPNGNNTANLNIYGGTVTSHGANPLAYFNTPLANFKIEGAPKITMSELAYGMVRFDKTTGTSLSLGLEDGYEIDINGKEYYYGNKPVIYAVSGITDNEAIASGMPFRYNDVYYKTLADAIALIPDGGEGTIYLLAPAALDTTISITNKKVTLAVAEGVELTEGQHHLTLTAGYAFDIYNAGTLTFNGLKISVTGTLVRYLAAASPMAQADRDIYVNFVGTTVTANGAASYFITSGSSHHGDTTDTPADQKKAGDSVTVTVDADSVINFTTSATGGVNFIDYNKNTHVNVFTVIDGTVNVTLTGDSESAFYFIHSNNPSTTQLTISETATVTVNLPTQRAATGKNFIISATGGNINSNKLTIHLDAITNDGALTLSGLKLYDSYSLTGDFDVCLIAANTDLEAVLVAWGASHGNTNQSNMTPIAPVGFRTQVGELYYYGSLNAMFAAAEDKGTIYMLSNFNNVYAATLGGKEVTLTGATTGMTLTSAATITLNEGGKLTVKDITINSATANVFYTSTAGNALTLDGVTVNYTAALKSNFIGIATGGKLAFYAKNLTFNSTNEVRIVYVSDGAALTSLKYESSTSTNGVLAMVQGATAVIGSVDAPAEIIDTTGGLVFYAYTGTIYANIYGGSFTTLVYGGDDCTNALDIKINPTGDKTTTFTRATASDAGVYSAFVHLHPATNSVQNVSFLLRNVTYTDTGAAPLFAVRDLANVSISIENSTFELSGAKLAGLPDANGVTFDSDATAALFGYAVRIGEEGGVYYKSVDLAANAAPATGVTTIYVVANHTTNRIGIDYPNVFSKKIHITSAEGGPYTVTGAANAILFYLGGGAEVTFTNIIYEIPYRLARLDGDANITFGDGCVMNHKSTDGIFIYNNGNAFADASKAELTNSMTNIIDIQKGAVINSTVATSSNGLIYHNGAYAAGAVKVTVKIAGTINTVNANAVNCAGTNPGTYRIYVDAASAVINTGTAAWVGNGKDVILFYNGTFESNAAAAEWAYGTGAYSLTINNDPAAEYKYSLTFDEQFTHTQHNVLNSNGGEIWQLRNAGSIYQTMQFVNEGTVTLKSYNGATVTLQNAERFRVQNTTLILDGITVYLNGGSSISIHGGSAAAPSLLKLVNGAKLTGPAANASQMIYFRADNGGQYSHLYVDETSSIEQTAPSAALANNSYVVWVHGGWANGSITIKGTVTTASSAANVYLFTLQGNGTNALTLDGAKLSITGTATGTAALVQVLGGCTLEYENINNSTLALDQATAATKHTLYVRGAIIFKGLSGDDAAAEAAKYNLGVNFGNVFSSVISTAIINQIPEGTKAEIVLTDTAYIYDTVQIFNRDVTFVGKNNANYDLIFEGAANGTAFLIVTNGTLTFKNMNIQTNAQLVAYSGTNNLTFANGVIEINLVNTDVTATLTGAYVVSATLFGSTAHAPKNSSNTYVQANSVTLNVDADSVINFTSPYAGTVYFISFNHNSHKWVYANIDGELNVNVTSDTDHETMLFRSNNPARTQITISETAKVTATLSATRKTNDKAYITSCTGGTSTDNKLTMHLSAISKDGALTVEGMKLFSAWTTSATFTALVIADDNTMSDVLMSWLGKNSNGGGSNTPFDEYPLAVSLALNGKVYYSSLGGVIALIPDGATATIQISSNMSSGGTINIANKTITLEGVGATKPTLTLTGNPAFQLGDNSHLILKNLDIIATTNFILTNGTDTKATTKIDIESGVTIDVRHYNGAYFFRAGSVGILTMNIKAGSSVKLLTNGTVRDGAVQGMFDFTSYSNKVAEGSVINVDGQVIYGLKFKGETAGNSRSAMFKLGDNTIDVIFTENADIQLLHENAIGGTWNAIVCLDSSSANTIVTFTGSKITLAAQCAIYGLNGTNFPGTYLVKDITLQSSGSFLVSDYAAAGGVNSTTVKFSGFALNGNALTQNNKLPYAVLMNIGFASEAEAFASNAYFTLIPGTYSNLGGAIEAAEDGATIYVNTSLVLTSATITNKSLTFAGAVDGIVITNASSGYLFTLGSGAHLTIKNLTYEGNYFAQFTAAAGTTSSLTLGEGTSIIGGALEKDAYIFYGSSLKGATVITIEAGASVIRPDTYTLTDAANPCPAIYRFQTSGAYTLNVYGELKNLTQMAPGVRGLAQIGYCNSQNGMIVNIYDGADIEATSDATTHNGYYQGIFYFAVYGNNKHEFNIYGGTIVSHGMCSMVYFGNYFVTVRIQGTPTIVMPDASYNMICMHNTKAADASQIEFYADVEVGATINLNGRSFFWHGAPEVSMITAGKFFTDDNAAQYGAGYRIIDEDGNNRYVAGLGAAASMSRNGGTIWLIGNVSDGGAGVVVNKYLFLKPVKPGLTITVSGSTPVIVINGGTETSPARFYIEDITFAGNSSSTLFSITGGGRAIIEMTNCNMNGGAGVIQMYDAAVATVTLTNGSYTMAAKPFYAIGYSDITVNATNITFTGTGTGDANSLFHLDGNAVGHWNIKGGSATTKWHTFYIRNVSTAWVNVEDFVIISDQWCFSSQSSSNWRVNLKNVDMVGKNCTATRMYGAAGSYVNIMGGSITSLTKDGTNPATMTFGSSIQVNIFDAYVHSSCMSAISGLGTGVNINIYGGTYLYNGTEMSYAPIMLPKQGNLTVKGGTFINTNSTGPVFSNLAYTSNKLVIEACNAIGKSSYLVMGNATTPTTLLDSFGHANLNGLTMERGARPGNIVGIDPAKGEMTFQASVNKDSYDYLAALSATGNVKFGMLVVPTALLNEGVDFTHFGLKNYINNFGDNLELGVDYFDYAATATEEEDGCWTLKATHTGIEPNDYTTKYSAIFYAEYEVTATNAAGEAVVTGKTESGVELTTAVVYRYADYEESANARSLAQVAFAAYNNPDEDFDASEKATLATWCGGDPTEKQLDLFLVAGGSNAVGNTPFSKEYADTLINHVCANCGHTADEALFAEAGYTCVNLLTHGKTMKIEDGVCFCTCGYSCDESEAPADMRCPATMVCGAAKETFQNALKDPITNVFYSGVVSDAAGSKSSAVCSAITLGLGWNGNMGPEFGMANELAKYYNAETGKYAAIMKYAVNNAALVEENAQFGNFSGKLYDNFMQTVSDHIKDYANFGYKVNIVGFYWMQGEADIAKADAYAEALQKLIANVRTDLAEITGADMSALPVVVGEIATFTGTANSADRVALKNAQNAVPGVIVDNTSAYMADANGIFLDPQNVLDTGARVVARILNATNADVVIPEIEATTEITDAEGNPIPGHSSLAMSLIAAPSGATITLKDNQTIYTSMGVTNRTDIVLDGAGNTVTLVTDAPALILQNASVTLENVVINHTGNAAAIMLDNASNLTIEEGTEINAKRTAIEMNGAASKLVINGGILTTTDENATSDDAIIRTSNANVLITDGYFEAAEGSSVISIDKNAAHKLIVNIVGGTFVAEDKLVEKKDAQGQIIPGEFDTIESITFVNNCPTAILVIDPDVLAANPTLDVYNVSAQ